MLEVADTPNIHLYTYSEIEEIDGYIGNFKIKVRRKARYVTDDCNGCGACKEVCPAHGFDDFNLGLNVRKAIYTYFAQAVPSIAQIDMEKCIQCGNCKEVCDLNAIDFNQKDKIEFLDVGTIVVATGFDIYPGNEYGHGKYQNVITQLELERILAPNGPTLGHLIRPSDCTRPKRILFINCAGSRYKKTNTYCSVVCCNLSVKNSKLVKSEYPDSEIVVSYIDMRCAGKYYEEYYNRSRDEGILFLKGHVGKITEDPTNNNLNVQIDLMGRDVLLNLQFEMIILSSASIPAKSTNKIVKFLNLEKSGDGFLKEMHPRLNVIDTKIPGVVIAGYAQGPKSIAEAITQGRAAAASLSGIMCKDKYTIPLIRAKVDKEACANCGLCALNCSYHAIKMMGTYALVDEILCKGCGTCLANCPSQAITLRYYREDQYESQIDAFLEA